jgi:Leucine-rich repeat (LRR) protein
MENSFEAICTLLVRTRLMAEAEVQALLQRWRNETGGAGDAAQFGKWLVDRGYVTAYQADRLLRGHTDNYFFNEYRLLDRLGQGRMAGVYKAVHRLGQVVAIKVLPPSKVKDPQAFGRFQREARLALRLKHPNVVRTFQTGRVNNLHYLVMEYLEGETLEEVLARRGKLPPDEAVRLVWQALQGLQHLHERDMVHRDLKPANLMLVHGPGGDQATLKILDIGVGRALFDEGDEAGGPDQDLTVKGDLLGSPDYMAPEQARDAHSADIRADVYALGCVLYHMLAGQPPFPGGNAVQKLIRHAREQPRPLRELTPGVSEGLQAIVSRMLAKDPAQRYATPEEAARALQAFLSRGPAAGRAWHGPRELEAFERWLAAEDSGVAVEAPAPIVAAKARQRTAGRKSPLAWVAAGVAVAAVLGAAAGVGYRLAVHSENRSLPEPESPPPGVTFEEWLENTKALPAEDQVKAVAARLREHNPDFTAAPKAQVQDGVVFEIELLSDDVTDLRPLQALSGLNRLSCTGSAPGKGKLEDLGPLRGLSLSVLDCGNTRVSDLSPLKDMPLVFLGISGTQVRDLSPLEGSPLLALSCSGTHITDLSALAGLPLSSLDAADTPVTDLSPLARLPLQSISCEVVPTRDAELLLGIATLRRVNGKGLDTLRQAALAEKQSFEKWARMVAALRTARQKADAVMDKLKERNPHFDGKYKHQEAGNDVVELRFVTDEVTDLAPLRALPKLCRLFCPGSKPGAGKLSNLQPLRGLPLTDLDCGWTQVHDVSPLKGMPLARLLMAGNPGVQDLSPLKGMKLVELSVQGAAGVDDLHPLSGMPLLRLNVAETQVSDLSPLRNMKLTSLAVHQTPVSSLSPLKDLPQLKSLTCDFRPGPAASLLRSLKLERLNRKPAETFWKEANERERALVQFVVRVRALPAEEQIKEVAARLKEANPGFDGSVTPSFGKGVVIGLSLSADNVEDLSAVRALTKLERLRCVGSAPGKGRLAYLPELKGMPLRELALNNTAVHDLAPLEGMRIDDLNLADTPVSDLSPLKKQPLTRLDLRNTRVRDLSPLKDSWVRELRCSPEQAAEVQALALGTLTMVNDKPVPRTPAPGQAVVSGAARGKKKPEVTASFLARVVGYEESRRNLRVELTQPVVSISDGDLYWLQWHQVQIVSAQLDPNPRNRLRRLQHHALWIGFHQARLYRIHAHRERVDLKLDEAAKVRAVKLEPFYDDKGNVRKPTLKELQELKGVDRLPGLSSSAEFLQDGQIARLYLSTGQVVQRGPAVGNPEEGNKVVDPRPRVTMVLILQ